MNRVYVPTDQFQFTRCSFYFQTKGVKLFALMHLKKKNLLPLDSSTALTIVSPFLLPAPFCVLFPNIFLLISCF